MSLRPVSGKAWHKWRVNSYKHQQTWSTLDYICFQLYLENQHYGQIECSEGIRLEYLDHIFRCFHFARVGITMKIIVWNHVMFLAGMSYMFFNPSTTRDIILGQSFVICSSSIRIPYIKRSSMETVILYSSFLTSIPHRKGNQLPSYMILAFIWNLKHFH